MKKKGIEATVLVEIILGLMILAIMGYFVYGYSKTTSDLSGKAAVQAWVLETGKKQEIAQYTLSDIGRPPVGQLANEPILISTDEQLLRESKRIIAEGMVECWDAFARGQVNFLGKNPDKEIFCYPCYTISFSESLKDKKLEGLNEFLQNQKPVAGPDQPTYFDILTNRDVAFTRIETKDDTIPAKDNLYIYFFAGSASTWRTIAAYSASGAVAGAYFGGPIGAALGALAGAGKVVFFDDPEFNAAVVLGNANLINPICNGNFDDLKQQIASNQIIA